MSSENISPDPVNAPPRVSYLWRTFSVVLTVLLLLAWALGASMFEQLKAQIHHLEKRLSDTPQVREISVLLDDQQLPALLVTYDPISKALQVQRLNEVKEGREESLHLWALTDKDRPRLLGVLTSRYKTTQLEVPPEALEGATVMGLSVEDKDKGPQAGLPHQPWVFKGWVVKRSY
jgi:anti-sigma-K factor RskA